MKLFRHTTLTDEFIKSWDIYERSFPSCERRTLEEQKRFLNDKSYFANTIHKNNKILGLLYYWKFDDYFFIEHIAINEEFRGKSYGSKILNEFLKDKENVVLEIEPIVDTITQKRLDFYKRLDFLENDLKHFQVPFRPEQERIPLLLLSYKKTINKKQYERVYTYMNKKLTI